MSDLHEDLTTAFAAVDPGAAPVEAAMLTGRKIKNRRRAGLLAGAVAVGREPLERVQEARFLAG